MSTDESGPPPTRPRTPATTPLDDVAAWLGAPVPDGAAGVAVTGLTLSSQRVVPGDLYAALPGARVHGIDFAGAAVGAGAVAVLTDPAGATVAAATGTGVPVLVVDDPRAVLGGLAARLHGEPATAMRMIGVTGTQGKTTTTRLAEAGLQGSGTRAAVVGTVGTRIDGVDVPTSLTTPEAPDLHGLFAVMRERGVEVCAMEVSSHALVMGRVDGVVFDVAVFLNLGRDHLDFHTDVEDYYRAKASLFTPERARLALVNLDDEHGRRLLGEVRVPVRTFSVRDPDADWRAVDVALEREGSTFTVVGPDGVRVEAGVPLPGGFNVANTLAAVAAAAEAGFDPGAVATAIRRSGGVPGRLERVEAGQDFLVVVDYAHKPDAVEAAVATLRPLAEAGGGRVVVVLGAGGDRDPGKRPIMGEIAARLADVLVVTDDNPRSEDPAAIRAAVLAGVAAEHRAQPGRVVEVGDRRAAIEHALGLARPGDVVLVAGKGHETGQEVDGVVHDFDDRVVARQVLEARP
ncbi:UDP-N-acetylmuramoyl-L-alanyl-D-glutamate--2,6-diaminopimelate ligase [Nocardioides dongxiaopingii]|uniref:UDP-N-acetylmuramoyl-L-alanyl-D-glutamate--2, 6-diaminopimelate ligase n=1 Tax=Nocardioides sp. S-1144 TaxID=2582905 RepID=UPI00110D30D3|nr:UDP-N-acetylmuramoyl-L-alanyl-D-glutamate--2,6-diaminopimelate ligase [Nocardioides sp. S-1144]QCW51176.1 UDP-N-acetylmuramoyl-L-alanyl-D-glutamate--2,6-diaminopimelate ligase [Nocardioides sp. S-1144]